MEEKKKDVYLNVDGKEIEIKITGEEANDAIMAYIESGKIERVYPLLKAGDSSISITLIKPTAFTIRMIERLIGDEVETNNVTNQEVIQIRNTAYLAAHLGRYKDEVFSDLDNFDTLEGLKIRYKLVEGLVANIRTALIDRGQHFVAFCAKIFELNSLENF